MLELINVNLTLDGKKILDDINLKFESDKFYCITGPNGSGKSTLALCLNALLVPNEGDVIIDSSTKIAKINVDMQFAYAKIKLDFD